MLVENVVTDKVYCGILSLDTRPVQLRKSSRRTTYGHPEGSAAGDITIIWNDVFK